MTEPQALRIARLGAQGDGVVETAQGQVFIPYALAGERVLAQIDGEAGTLIEVLEQSRDRVVAPCRHFGVCGGCKLQHISEPPYLAFKRDIVATAFRTRGLEVEIVPTVACRGPRRRAVFSARATDHGPLLGFHRAASHELIDVHACNVLHPAIVGALDNLRQLVAPVLARTTQTRVVVTWTAGGLDVALDQLAVKLTPHVRARLATLASAARVARVSIASDPVYEALSPSVSFGRAAVVVPPGSFIQAVAEMEEKMAQIVRNAVGKSRSVADLFCGVGAFSLRLAEHCHVFSADSEKAAIAALQQALRTTKGLKPVDARVRDLFREPLSATELRDYDCVVFDPPRAGADAQARMIAKSKVKTIVAVSCNPATLARDARTIVDGGYRLESVTPLDQFLYSPHVEVVAVFRR